MAQQLSTINQLSNSHQTTQIRITNLETQNRTYMFKITSLEEELRDSRTSSAQQLETSQKLINFYKVKIHTSNQIQKKISTNI